jgi:TPR repeat protein
MKHVAAFLLFLLSPLHPAAAQAQTADAAALRAAHEAYFRGFPNDRSGLLVLGNKGNPFAAMMLERSWQRASFGPVSEIDGGGWRDRALAADVPKRLEALAAKDNGIAMTWLGSANCYGLLGMSKDQAQCAAWYGKGAERGEVRAQRLFAEKLFDGSGVEKNPVEAVGWMKKAADQGDAYAQREMGRAYGFGRGVAQDEAQAVSWYRKAAEQGDDDAQFSLGFAYRNGRGVPKDAAQGLSWFRKAAEQGNANAQYAMGAVYWKGEGVPKDGGQAVAWFRKAADQDDVGALDILGFIHQDNNNVCAAIDAWERAAPRHNDGSIHLNLARLYWNRRELVSAWQSLRLAREKGGVTEDDFTTRLADIGGRLDRTEPWRAHIEREFPTLRDAGNVAQRKASMETFLSQIDNRVYVEQGQGTWSDDKLYLGYTEYTWCPQSGHLFSRGDTLDGKYETRHGYRLDPQTGVYRGVHYTVGMVLEVFLFPDLGTGEVVTKVYELNKRGKRSSLMSNGSLALQADGRLKSSSFGPFDRKGTTTYSAAVDRSRLPALGAAVKQAEAERKQASETRKSESGGLLRTLLGAAVGATMAGTAGGDAESMLGAAMTGAQIFGGGDGASGGVAGSFASTLNSELAKQQHQDAQQQHFLDDVRRQAEAVDRGRRQEQERQRQAQARASLEQQTAVARQQADAQAAEQARQQQAAQQAEQQRVVQHQAAERAQRQADVDRQAQQRRMAEEQARAQAQQALQQSLLALRNGFRGEAITCPGGGKDVLYLRSSVPARTQCNSVRASFEARCPGTPQGAGVRFSQANYVGASCGMGDNIRIGQMPCGAEQVQIAMTEASCG